MGLYKYSLIETEGQKLGKAQLHDQNCSYKDVTQVFKSIRGKSLPKAEKILEEAIAIKKAIPYARFATKIGHRSELGGQKGRYPKKECKLVLQLIQNARSNAIQKGMDESLLFVKHAAAYKQNVLKRYRNYFAGSRTLGYGKNAVWSNYVTCWMELAVAEMPSKEGKKAAAKEAKPAHAKEAKGEPKVEAKVEKKAEAKPAPKAQDAKPVENKVAKA